MDHMPSAAASSKPIFLITYLLLVLSQPAPPTVRECGGALCDWPLSTMANSPEEMLRPAHIELQRLFPNWFFELIIHCYSLLLTLCVQNFLHNKYYFLKLNFYSGIRHSMNIMALKRNYISAYWNSISKSWYWYKFLFMFAYILKSFWTDISFSVWEFLIDE